MLRTMFAIGIAGLIFAGGSVTTQAAPILPMPTAATAAIDNMTRPQPPPQLGPQAPQPGAQPGPEATQPPPQPGRHPGPQPGPQRSRPQRSRQQRRPHCTSVMLSIAAVAAVGIGRMGAAWVVTDPPAKMRPAIPIANIVRSIMCPPFLLELTRARHRESHPDPTQNQGLPFHE